ncbi:Protein WVD2-like [Actinidia chinensis var. chinensis]|uniref:Protein WVD2-like n=1 Tax=Actinidia chinensis var. chinensis TaxID=1590841 RepID=A0A2R6RFI9_ACTCC|nr:Protein WVD2-like [Actinidia chinensis var. chinensis]
MGESSACLVRSFSAGTSSEHKEGDPLRALTTSISFGRFMSESLAWEKWSCFSNNRYLEEAERSSKPGSVAEKKAYFEAHYKRIADAKKAAALLEQQNAASNESDLPEPNVVDDTQDNSSTDSELSKSDSHVGIDEMQENEAPNTQLFLSVNANACDSNVERNKSDSDEVEPTTELVNIGDNLIRVELSNQYENVENHNKTASTQQEKMPIVGAANQGNLASTSDKKRPNSSSKPFTNFRSLKPQTPLKRSPVRPSKEERITPTSKKVARDVVKTKRPTPKSLHMSINFSSHAGETSKTSSPIIQNIGNLKVMRTFVKTSRDKSTPLRTPTGASVSGFSVHSSAIPQPERRSKTLDDCSGSGRRAVDGKSQSPFLDRFKPSGASGHRARPPVVASSFRFMCEERAAKRKEKLEEKLNAEAEKVCLQAKSKEKAEELKNMHQSTGFQAKPIPNFHRETKSPSNHTNKMPLTLPRSPKLGRKPFPSMVQDTGSRPLWRSSLKIDGSKNVREKSIQTPLQSINTLLRKNIHENASPNIQL